MNDDTVQQFEEVPISLVLDVRAFRQTVIIIFVAWTGFYLVCEVLYNWWDQRRSIVTDSRKTHIV